MSRNTCFYLDLQDSPLQLRHWFTMRADERLYTEYKAG